MTATPSTLTLTPGVAQNLTLPAANCAKAGTATITLTGKSGILTHSATIALTITATAPSPDFSLSVCARQPQPDCRCDREVSFCNRECAEWIYRQSECVCERVALWRDGKPVHAYAHSRRSSKPDPVGFQLRQGRHCDHNVYRHIRHPDPHRNHLPDNYSRSTCADFSLTAAPTTLTVTAGAAGKSASVSANALNGFTSNVSVSLTGLPTGVIASPSTLTLAPGVAQSLTLSASTSAKAGTATMTLTGTSGALTHTVTIALTITAAASSPDFSLTVAPPTLSVTAGRPGSQLL